RSMRRKCAALRYIMGESPGPATSRSEPFLQELFLRVGPVRRRSSRAFERIPPWPLSLFPKGTLLDARCRWGPSSNCADENQKLAQCQPTGKHDTEQTDPAAAVEWPHALPG